MRWLALAFGLLCSSMGLAAPEEQAADRPELSDREMCELVARYAQRIMKARQIGVPMTEIMPTTDDHATRETMEGLIILAYEHPRFSSEEYQQKAVTDFENDMFLSCLKQTK